MRDLNGFVRRSAGRSAAHRPGPAAAAQREDIQRGRRGRRGPDFDVYVGEDDDTSGASRQHRVRRAGGGTARPRRHRGRARSSSRSSSRDVNGDQEIEAPARRGRCRRSPTRSAADRRAGRGGAPGQEAGDPMPAQPDGAVERPRRRGLPGTTRSASTRRAPRTPSAPALRRAARSSPRRRGAAPLRRSRSGSMPQRSASSACSGPSPQRSGRSSPSWSGVAPFSSIEPRVVADRADRGDLLPVSTGSAGTAASSSRLRSIGFAPGPAPGSASARRTPRPRARGSRRRRAAAA